MKFEMYHYNITVANEEKSVEFYKKAFGLEVKRRHETDDFIITIMANAETTFYLEITCYKNHPQKYDLGENETHIAFRTDEYEKAHALHKEMNAICFENEKMGIYFVEDPDGYWVEIVPQR